MIHRSDTKRNCRGGWRTAGALGLVAAAVFCWAAPAAGQFNGDFSSEPHALDAENFLDWKAYQSPILWRHEWFLAKNAMRGSVGSVSQEQFFQSHEIKLEADLGRYATFLYYQREEAFFRPDPLYQEVEMRFGRQINASVIGFTRPEKIQGHQGYALAYGKRTDDVFARLSHLDHFALFNQRNKEPERFAPTPGTDRLEARYHVANTLFAQVDVKRETPTKLVSPVPPEVQRYEGRKFDLMLDWFPAGPDTIYGLTYTDNEEERRQEPNAPTAEAPRQRQVLQWRWLDLYGSWRQGGQNRFTLGLLDSTFRNHIASTTLENVFRHRLTTLQGYATWERNTDAWLQWLFSFHVGAVQRMVLDYRDPKENEDRRTNQIKFGAGIVLAEANTYRFLFNSTWDLDLLDKRQWDGGNLQLQFHF